jgi:hypothetical protein
VRHQVAGPQALGQPLGQRDEELVTDEVAEAVVDQLEAVEVQEEHRELVRAALGTPERAEQPVEERLAIGQASECVVPGHVLEELLACLALGDVRGHSGQAQDPPLLVPHRRPAAQHPDVAAVAAEQAVLAVEAGALPLQVRRDVGLQGVDVFGVDTVEPFRRPVADLVLVRPHHGLPARGVVDPVRGEVPVPDPVVGPAGGQGVALLAPAQRIFLAPPLGHVPRLDDHPRPLLRPGEGSGERVQASPGAVGMAHA